MRAKKAMKNMVAAMIYQVVAIICGLITPRLILSSFGSSYNGVVSSATQFLSMISILTLGITGSTRVALYKTLANNDVLATSRIMKATKQYMRKVALCVIGYAAILCAVYPFVAHNDLTHLQNAAIIAIVSIGTFAQYFFGISNQTLLKADQVGYITYGLDIFKTIANTILVAVLIYAGGSIYTVKLGSSLVFLVTPAIMNVYVKKKYSLISNCEPSQEGLAQRGAVAVHSIANMVHDNAALVVLTLFTDAKIISVYTVYYLVIGKIKSLLHIVTSGMEAAFANMWVKEEYDTLKRNFSGFEYVIFVFTAIVFSCVAMLILPFVAVYTRGISDVQYVRMEMALFITIAEAVFCIRQPYLILVYATGSYKATRKGAVVEAIINIVVSVSLTAVIGVVGVVIGTLVANAFRTTQYIIFTSKQILKTGFINRAKRVLWLAATILAICGISLAVKPMLPASLDWTGWIAQAVVVFTIACVVTLVSSLAFYKKDMNLVFSIAKKMIVSKK